MGEISGHGPGIAGTSAVLPLTSPILLMLPKDSQFPAGYFRSFVVELSRGSSVF